MSIPKRGDIIHVSLDPTKGTEIKDGPKGGRYAMVLSAEAFNRQSGLILVAPITQGGAASRATGFSVTLLGAGTETQGIVLCDQTRTIDARAREWKLIERAPDVVVKEALDAVASILE